MADPNTYTARSGRMVKEDGTVVNVVDEGMPVSLTGGIVQVAEVSAVTILAGSSSIVLTAPNVVVSDFKKISVGFNADASHPVRTALHWQPTGGATYLLEEVINGTSSRSLTNHIETKGIRCAVQIFNDDTVDHTYDVVVLGVR
jgi:hypothetical protein